MMKRWIAILILAMLAACAAAGCAEQETEMDKVFVICQIDSHVIVRSSPRKKGMEYAIGEAGDWFWTDWKERNGYLHVYGNFEDSEGLICKRYVTVWEPYVYRDGKKFKVNVDRVNCRQYIGGKRKGTLIRDSVVTVYVETPEWCVTSCGYIQTKFLDEVEDEADR